MGLRRRRAAPAKDDAPGRQRLFQLPLQQHLALHHGVQHLCRALGYHQYILGTLPGLSGGADVDDVLDASRSVRQTLDEISRQQMLLAGVAALISGGGGASLMIVRLS